MIIINWKDFWKIKSKNIINAILAAQNKNMISYLFTKNKDVVSKIHKCVITGTSEFPGQTGGNNNNFHFEDCVMKISHIATGLLKELVQNVKS